MWEVLSSIHTLVSPEVESSKTSLALRTSSKTHFEVLGLGLEALGPRKLPCPRLEDSTIFWTDEISLENARNLAENLQIGRYLFRFLQLKFHQWQNCDKKAYCFFSFSFYLAFFAYTSSEQQYWRPGAPGPPQISIFASQFKHKPGRNG